MSQISPALAALQAAVRRRTVAGSDKDPAQFEGLHGDLRAHFPRLFEACESVELPDHALLLRWRGSGDERPVVLMAHQDVVPVNSRDDWTHPAYEAVVADEFLWGRGALDCKGSLIAICAAVEQLIVEGVTPSRDVWLSFSSDEEIAGHTAPAAVTKLKQRGVEPWFVLDEGGMAVTGVFPGVDAPLAVIGLAEKGLVVVRLTARAEGGHASMPPRRSAPAILAKAILALEKHPAPSNLTEPSLRMLETIAPHAKAPVRQLLSRAGSMRKPLTQLLARTGPATAAMVRTTYAVTQLEGSPAQNVLATDASATVNVRVSIDESAEKAVARIRRILGDDIEVAVLTSYDPSPVAAMGDAYELIASVTEQVMPDVVPTPYVVMAATDARHFQREWPDCYRFNPFRMTASQRESLHNVDERLEVSSFEEGIRWYTTLLTQI